MPNWDETTKTTLQGNIPIVRIAVRASDPEEEGKKMREENDSMFGSSTQSPFQWRGRRAAVTWHGDNNGSLSSWRGSYSHTLPLIGGDTSSVSRQSNSHSSPLNRTETTPQHCGNCISNLDRIKRIWAQHFRRWYQLLFTAAKLNCCIRANNKFSDKSCVCTKLSNFTQTFEMSSKIKCKWRGSFQTVGWSLELEF